MRALHSPDPVAEPHLRRAIDWMLLLSSGQADDESIAAYDFWRQADPAHRAAGDHVESAVHSFTLLREQGVSSDLAGRSMARASRRATLRGGLACAGLLGTGGLGWQLAVQPGLLADQHTGVAQRHQHQLAGGTQLWLDARSAVDTNAASPALRLHHGQMLVHAPAGVRPALQIHARDAIVETGGGRFVVQARARQPVRVTSLEGSATVRADGRGLVVPARRCVELAPQQPPKLTAALGTEDLWTRGLIALSAEPLGRLVEALQDYHPGRLQASPAAAQVRISGLFSLDDPQRTLLILTQTQPLRLRAWTKYWVTIETA
jgi:transmembrane sensor